MDRPELERSLDAALLTEEEMLAGPAVWSQLNDPFAAHLAYAEASQQQAEANSVVTA